MNYETSLSRQGEPLALGGNDFEQRRRRRRLLIIAGAIALALIAAFLVMRGRSAPPPAAPARQAPPVTVVVPGRQTVQGVVSANGNLAARRELPVGVAGEGGQVNQVLVEPGQWVGAGQVLATVDRRVQAEQAASLNAQISVAQADANLAQANLERALRLRPRGFVSQADIDRLTATRDGARARVQVARAQYGQAVASNARLDIRAPAAGLVLERRVEPGQIVSPASGVLFRMAKGGEFELLARLGEADLQRMRVGLPATVTPVGSDQSYQGQIWQVSPVVDPQTRLGTVRVALPYNNAIRPGGFAEARIVSGTATVPLLPQSAVQSDDKGNFAYIVDGNNKVVRRNVKVGEVSDAGVTVLEGLTGQERVVLSAGAFLNPGETVAPKLQKR